MKKAVAMLAWVTLLMAIPTALYVNHVYDQRREVRENNLRTLSKAAETMNQTFATAVANVRNLDPADAEFVCEFLDRQPYLEWGVSRSCDPDELEGAQFEDAVLRAGSGGIQVQAGLGDADASAYSFDVQLNALLEDIPFSDALELLFVVDQQGNVIHQHRPAGRRDAGLVVRSLDGLPINAEAVYQENGALHKASSINRLQLSGVEYQLLCQPLLLHRSAKGGGSDDAAEGWLLCGLVDRGRSFRQSLLVAPSMAFAFLTVTVFGFLTWPAIKLRWMSTRDRLYFADMAFLLFGTWGGLMLATILILGVGSFLVLDGQSENNLKHLALQIENNLQQEIDSLALAAYEFDLAVAELVSADRNGNVPLEDVERLYGTSESNRELRERWKQALEKAGEWPISSDFNMVFWAGPDGRQFLKATVFNENTPRVDVSHREYFKAARQNRLWQGPDSRETLEVPRFVEPIRSVTTGRFATIVSICSQITLERLAASGHADAKSADPRGCPVVAAIEAFLVSTSRPVLAPGTGFAIIDDQGTVKLHSDERRALFENLYEEMDEGDRLQAMVLGRASQAMKTSYLGRPHQVFVKPLNQLPWSVVTFTDTELITTTNIEIIGHAAIVALIFLLIYALLTLCYFLVRGSEIPLWFWPGSISRNVARSRYVTTLAALLLVIGISAYDTRYLPLAAASIPLLIFTGTYLAYRRTSRRHGRSDHPGDVSPLQVRSSITSSFILCIAAAIIPAGIFFATALDNQVLLLVRYENEHLAERLVDRNCTVDDHYRNVDLSANCSDECRDCRALLRRAFTAGDIYRSAMFWPGDSPGTNRASRASNGLESLADLRHRCSAMNPRTQGNPAGDDASRCKSSDNGPGETVWNLFARYKPIYNPTVRRSRYLSPNDEGGIANNACWSWQPGRARAASSFTATGLACDTGIELESDWPLRASVYLQWPVLLMGALLLIVLSYWTNYGSRRIFFGSLRMPPLRGREGLEEALREKPNDSGCRLIVTAASQLDRAALLKPSADQEPSDTHGRFVRYDMMDYFKGESHREDMLSSLERDVAADRNVLVISPLDPFTLLVPDEPPKTDDQPEHESRMAAQKVIDNLHRWRHVLSHFRVVILSFNLRQPWSMSTSIWQRGLDKPVDEEWLKAEFEAVPELDQNYSLIAHDLIGTSRRNALDRIGERAFGYYVALWDACSEEEKLVLVQLTFENVVNPKQMRVVRRLMQRGFIMRDPELRIMNQSFARFIAQVQDPLQVREWEHKGEGMSWVHARWVLLAVLVLGLVFLLGTQRELFNTTMMFLSAGAVSIPGLMKAVTNLSRLGSNGSK